VKNVSRQGMMLKEKEKSRSMDKASLAVLTTSDDGGKEFRMLSATTTNPPLLPPWQAMHWP